MMNDLHNKMNGESWIDFIVLFYLVLNIPHYLRGKQHRRTWYVVISAKCLISEIARDWSHSPTGKYDGYSRRTVRPLLHQPQSQRMMNWVTSIGRFKSLCSNFLQLSKLNKTTDSIISNNKMCQEYASTCGDQSHPNVSRESYLYSYKHFETVVHFPKSVSDYYRYFVHHCSRKFESASSVTNVIVYVVWIIREIMEGITVVLRKSRKLWIP